MDAHRSLNPFIACNLAKLNQECNRNAKYIAGYASLMDSRADRLRIIRRDRFNGSTADLGAAIGKSPAQIGQWFSGYRNIGDGVARQIETRLGLNQGYLDGQAGPSNDQIVSAALASVHDLTTPELVGLIDALTKVLRSRYDDE